MVDLGGFADKAKNFASENPDKVEQGIQGGGDMVDEHTGNRFQDQVDQAQEHAGGLVGEQNPEDQQN
ncbi:hypothetical protein CKW39_05350 [Kocuria sp. WRN011]|uniref:antitoxin n=1 Tax=Kocuria sp. WRN011 TaxID=2029858 RepID=UPI000BAF64A0|nr:antitoxin [Kocuria sp. WRN011]PBB08990.1 hypothetical protein CKW39_05350 [Kocuria sp. WRN011]